MNNNIVWVVWEKQRRSIELAAKINAKLLLYNKYENKKILRYIFASFYTIKNLFEIRPKVVIAQNPSIVLAVVVILIRKILDIKVVIDRHSNFMFNKKQNLKYKIFHKISNYTIKNANLTIVTNDYLKSMLKNISDNVFILQDMIPSIVPTKLVELEGEHNVVYICSFDSDEPVTDVIAAFAEIKNIHLYVTGNFSKYVGINQIVKDITPNIHLTGYIDDEQYINMLAASDAIIVLTKSNMTLNCGAYEAVALEKPMILSNTDTIKSYFSMGAVYCEPNKESIKNAVNKCMSNIDKLKIDTKKLKYVLQKNWDDKYNDLMSILNR